MLDFKDAGYVKKGSTLREEGTANDFFRSVLTKVTVSDVKEVFIITGAILVSKMRN